MDVLTSFIEMIQSGGAYAIIVIFAYGILSGRIRLGREMERVEKLLEDTKFEWNEDRERAYMQLERQQTILEELLRSVNSREHRRDTGS